LSNQESKYSNIKKKPGKTKAFFICLMIASFLWLAHSLNTVYTHTFKIPVSFKNLPQNKKPIVPIPEQLTVDVKASGLKLSMMLISKSNEQLELDFNTLKGINRNLNYVISASKINFKQVLGFEAQIKHVSPDTLYFSEKTGYQKNVALKVPMYLKCRQGYAYRKPEINPVFITIFGDTADILPTDTIYTQPVNLVDLNQSISLKPLIIKPKPGIYSNITEVSVFIEVEKLIEQSITVPVSDLKFGKNRVNLFPAFVKIKFTAIQNNFDVKDTNLFKAAINSDNINRITKKCDVFLSTVPGNVTVMDIEPKQIEILILK
jgi:hypothetical protein